MKNLIEKFRKKEKDRSIPKINKTKYEQSKSINDILRPIYILSIIFGFRIFGYPQSYSRTILSFLYSMLLCCMYNTGRYYNDGRLYNTKVFNLNETIAHLMYTINNILIFIIPAIGLYQSQMLKLYIKRINEIDKTLQTLGSSTSFNSIYKRTIIEITIAILYVFLSCTIIIVNCILKDQQIYKSTVIYCVILQYIYSFMIKFILIFEFFTLVRCLKSEFQRANELLSDINILPISSIASELIEHKEADGSLSIERLLPVDSKKLFTTLPSLRQAQLQMQVSNLRISRSRTLLRTIRQVHLELHKMSKNFSNIYGIQISLEMAICVLRNTYLLYSLYILYQEEIQDISEMIFQSIITILFCLQYSTKIFVVSYICDKTTKEAEHTNEIIHTFYGQSTDYEIKKEVEIFSLQMMQCSTVYSTFGLYNLNCKHICSCIGIITTYIVIMIQVNDSVKRGS